MRGEVRFNQQQIESLNKIRNDQAADTLLFVYQSAPNWIALSYGNSPESYHTKGRIHTVPFDNENRSSFGSDGRQIKIEGAKTFRFSGQSSGSNAFGQSLDLTISGNLSPGVELSGTISDRGRSTSYGPVNLQLSELDRVKLAVTSKKFSARIGDISVQSMSGARGFHEKSISGVESKFSSTMLSLSGVVGRPKGQFKSSDFLGKDNLQGPYRIVDDILVRIVPGSEKVRVDGQPMSRGEHKDYTIDYATGTITFTVGYLINSRSRIEIDFEVLQNEFRGELLGGSAGVSSVDSSVQFSIGWLREGDDQSKPLGYLPDLADSILLEQSGDDISMLVRSGVTIDSLGAYELVSDSLPDSIYLYVGAGNGDYSINFSNVGANDGLYNYLGGDRYQFVGAGNGDYAPIINLSVPKRTDQLNSRLLFGNQLLGKIALEYQHESHDQNRYSPYDDEDNGSTLSQISYTNKFKLNGRTNQVKLSYRYKDQNYNGKSRLYQPDFAYKLHLPVQFVPSTDERIMRGHTQLAPVEKVTVEFATVAVQYRGWFESVLTEYKSTFNLFKNNKIWYEGSNLNSKLDSGTTALDGSANKHAVGLEQKLKFVTVKTEYERSKRVNFYVGEERGTKYSRLISSLSSANEKITAEFYSEDSLIVAWSKILDRQEYKLQSNRKILRLQYDLVTAYSRIKSNDSARSDYMGRVNYNYRPSKSDYSFGGSYLISNEQRNGRSIRYQEVTTGTGNYIFEDSQYIPQVNGDYILLDEILSDRQQVQRSEKEFHYQQKFSFGMVRASSRIKEELLEGDSRSAWWAVPFWSNSNGDFLFYERGYNANLKLFRLESGYGVTIDWDQLDQSRFVAGSSNQNHEISLKGTLREKISQYYAEQSISIFEFRSDHLYGSSSDIEGKKLKLGLIRTAGQNETKLSVSYRVATSSAAVQSKIYAASVGYKYRVVKRGEIRLSTEFYRQLISNSNNTILSFRLTENKPGSRGVVWKFVVNYRVGHKTRINFLIDGRHSDNRNPRLFLRGEMVVGL